MSLDPSRIAAIRARAELESTVDVRDDGLVTYVPEMIQLHDAKQDRLYLLDQLAQQAQEIQALKERLIFAVPPPVPGADQ